MASLKKSKPGKVTTADKINGKRSTAKGKVTPLKKKVTLMGYMSKSIKAQSRQGERGGR